MTQARSNQFRSVGLTKEQSVLVRGEVKCVNGPLPAFVFDRVELVGTVLGQRVENSPLSSSIRSRGLLEKRSGCQVRADSNQAQERATKRRPKKDQEVRFWKGQQQAERTAKEKTETGDSHAPTKELLPLPLNDLLKEPGLSPPVPAVVQALAAIRNIPRSDVGPNDSNSRRALGSNKKEVVGPAEAAGAALRPGQNASRDADGRHGSPREQDGRDAVSNRRATPARS